MLNLLRASVKFAIIYMIYITILDILIYIVEGLCGKSGLVDVLE